MIARGDEQFVKRSPVVSPVEIEADALPKFGFVNFAAPPFVEDVLIAREDGFDPKNDGTIASRARCSSQRGGIALSGGQGVIVTDQDHVGGVQRVLNLAGVEQEFVAAICLIEFAKIFAAAVRILSTDFTLHSRQRVQLGSAAAGSKIGG